MMLLSVLFGEISVVLGLITGYYFSIPPGGTIVMISIVILLLSIAGKKFSMRAGRKKVLS